MAVPVSRAASSPRARAAALAERHQGTPPPDTRLTLAAFLDDWLEAQRQRVRARTYQSYVAATRLYIVPSIGQIPVGKLQPEHVARM